MRSHDRKPCREEFHPSRTGLPDWLVSEISEKQAFSCWPIYLEDQDLDASAPERVGRNLVDNNDGE